MKSNCICACKVYHWLLSMKAKIILIILQNRLFTLPVVSGVQKRSDIKLVGHDETLDVCNTNCAFDHISQMIENKVLIETVSNVQNTTSRVINARIIFCCKISTKKVS